MTETRAGVYENTTDESKRRASEWIERQRAEVRRSSIRKLNRRRNR